MKHRALYFTIPLFPSQKAFFTLSVSESRLLQRLILQSTPADAHFCVFESMTHMGEESGHFLTKLLSRRGEGSGLGKECFVMSMSAVIEE